MPSKTSYSDLVTKFNSLNLSWNVTEEQYATMSGKSKATFACKTHNIEWSNSSISNVYTEKKKCTECRKLDGPKDRAELFKTKGVELLRSTSESKGIFKCLNNQDHVEWEERIQQVEARSYGCFQCRGKDQQSTRSKISRDDVIAKMETLGYTIAEGFGNTDTIGTFQCSKGHSWTTTIGNVYRELSGCPDCSKPSSEAAAIFILETLLDKPFNKTRSILPSGLELDGYNPELKLAVEYNGSQHYVENRSYFHREEGSFQAQQERDSIKRADCVAKKITLIDIHYTINTFDRIREFLESELTRLHIPFATNLNWVELKKTLTYANEHRTRDLNNIISIAESRNGKCLSDVYIDSFHPMLFKCEVAEHSEFEKTPTDIRRNVWCNDCAHNAPVTDQKVNEHLKIANMEFVEGSNREGDKSKVLLRCKTLYQHTSEVIWSNFKQRPYCPKCGSNNGSLASHIPIYKYDLDNRFVSRFNVIGDIPNSTAPKIYAIKNVALKRKGRKAYDHIWSFLAPVNGMLDEQKERTPIEADIIEKLQIRFD